MRHSSKENKRLCFFDLKEGFYLPFSKGRIVIQTTLFRREKLIHRELESVEQLAGIALGRNRAFVIGNAEVNHRDKELNISLESHYRKESQSNEYLADIVAVYYILIEYTADVLGD